MSNPHPELHPENLRPAKPGEVRNPRGSSNKQRLTNALIKAIEEKGLDDPFVKVGLQHALKGDFRFWSYIFDRIDGKQPEKILSGDDDGPAEGITIPAADPRYAAPKGRRKTPRRDRKRKPAAGDDCGGPGGDRKDLPDPGGDP